MNNKKKNKKLLYVVNVDWFFISHRLPIAIEAIKQGYEVHIATTMTSKKEKLVEHGIKVHELIFERKSQNIFSSFKLALKLYKIINKLNPDIIHLVTIKPVIIGGIISRMIGVRSLVISISGLGYTFTAAGIIATIRKSLILIVYKFIFNHDNIKIIFQNEDDLNLLSNNLNQNKIIIIKGSGVNLNLYKYKNIPNGIPLVIMASRLIADKGVIEYLQAIKLLKQKGCKTKFVLIGNIDIDNPTTLQKSDIFKYINEGIVEWWGHRTNMHQILPQAHLIVLPSYREGMPKILLEAAACGRAIITTDVPGCKDAIIPNVTGLLVPARNYIDLADKIEYLLARPVKLRLMGLSGRKLAENEFDIIEVVKKHVFIYNDLLKIL